MIDRAETDSRDRSTERIRREIDHTRARMDETLDALARRFRPGAVAGDLWERLKGEAGIGDVVRQHPIPLAFMGLGLGWLAVEEATGGSGDAGPERGRRRRSSRRRDPSDDEREGGEKGRGLTSSVAEYAADTTEKVEEAKDRISGSARSAGRRARESADDAATVARDVTRRASDAAEAARDRTARAAARAGGEIRESARRLRRGAADLAEEKPLVLGATAFGLGLLGGLLVPGSRAEDRAVGPASDRVKEEGGRLARETADRAAGVAERTVDAAAGAATAGAREAAESVEREAERAADRVQKSDREEGEGPESRDPEGPEGRNPASREG